MDTSNFSNKNGLVLLLFLLLSGNAFAQITLEEALTKARENNPTFALKQVALAEKEFKLKNIQVANRPDIRLLAQATYQSEVTALDIPIPNIEFESLSRDQYKIQAEISQNIYDGGLAKQRKKIQNTSSDLEILGAELELEKVRAQIIPIYFSILEIDAGTQLLALKKEDLLARQKISIAAVENGSLLKMELQSLEAALLLLEQQAIALNIQRKQQVNILAILTGMELAADIPLQKPKNLEEDFKKNNQSLQYQFFQYQKSALDQADELALAINRPKLGAFLQAGYGKPGLNFLKNEFAPYYILGARVQWNLNGLYTQSNDREIQKQGQEKIQLQTKSYDQKISIQESTYRSEIMRLKLLIDSDEKLVAIRQKIKNTAQVQFDNGVMIAADYLQRLNEENQARQNKKLHELQLLKNQYLLQHISSNYTN